jgi:polyisoprenoid-binding protein YceI
MKTLLLPVLLIIATQLNAQTLVMSDETSTVKYETKHLAGLLEGDFKGVKGTATFDAADLAHSNFRFQFDAATVTVNDNYLGPNLIKEECFDPAKYPNIQLASRSITKLSEANKYQFNGNITIKGVRKPVSFPMTATANVGGYDFSFSFSINKKDFNLKCATGKDLKFLIKTYGKKA